MKDVVKNNRRGGKWYGFQGRMAITPSLAVGNSSAGATLRASSADRSRATNPMVAVGVIEISVAIALSVLLSLS